MRIHPLTALLPLLPVFLHADNPISQVAPQKANYPANFQVEAGVDLFVFGDYLYWIAQEDNLFFGQANHIKKIDPHFENALRLGVGVNFPSAGFDGALSWLWFKTDAHQLSQGSCIPLWAEPDLNPFVAASLVQADWNLDMNLFDFEWGRASWFGGHFSLRPFFGLRGGWINQDLHNQFLYETAPAITGNLYAKSNVQVGGLRAGGEGRFTIPYGFSIYALTSGSLLYGHFDAGAKTTEEGVTIGSTQDRFWQGTSTLQMALGLGWETHFAAEKFHIEFHIGWEQNIWFGINKMNRFINELGKGYLIQEKTNLSTQGLTVGGRFDF